MKHNTRIYINIGKNKIKIRKKGVQCAIQYTVDLINNNIKRNVQTWLYRVESCKCKCYETEFEIGLSPGLIIKHCFLFIKLDMFLSLSISAIFLSHIMPQDPYVLPVHFFFLFIARVIKWKVTGLSLSLSLPRYITSPPSVSTFKSSLNTYLYCVCFNWMCLYLSSRFWSSVLI